MHANHSRAFFLVYDALLILIPPSAIEACCSRVGDGVGMGGVASDWTALRRWMGRMQCAHACACV